jgi:riboflavin-specific deaminase-like protein
VLTCHFEEPSAPAWRQELQRLRASHDGPARPFITASFACSADDCLSDVRGAPTQLSSPAALRVTHALRSLHDALLVGVNTVLSDDPLLTTRLVPGPSPRRVVLDSRLRVPRSARVLSAGAGPALLFATSRAGPDSEEALRQAGAEVVRVEASAEGVSLEALLRQLQARGVTSLMVEGGAAVLESFFRAGLVDFLAVTRVARRLDNPRAVRLGPATLSAVSAAAPRSEAVGPDVLRFGPVRAGRDGW